MDLGSYGGAYPGEDGAVAAGSVTGEGESGAGLGLTAQAASKIEQLARERGGAGALLRVYIEGGGCSGFQYGFELAEAPEADDLVFEHGAVKVLCDPLSYQYLAGAELDYREDLQGARFLIHNPNASTTCGCGSSFSV